MNPQEKSSNQVLETYISPSGIPYRKLGRTDEKISIIGLGGAHIGTQSSENESIKIIRTAIDNGINFMDNSWDYNGGNSEVCMGKALQDGYRNKVVLMTKIDGHTKEKAVEQINESLQRLKTETIDLLQFHEVIRMSDPDRIFADGGGMEAVLEAQKEGKVRYVGFTGHKDPKIHLKMLQTAFNNNLIFDTVQIPLNVVDAHSNGFEKEVLPVCLENNIGVLGMKALCNGLILKNENVSAEECLHYTMSLPVSTVITGCESIPILQQALRIARNFIPMNENRRSELLSRTEQITEAGECEPWKTGTAYDDTLRNPHWLA